jgi:1,4-dihydroxy-2-naphthoate octaprenyltransferase
MGALITAILVVNNLRDIKSDQAAGKYTLAVRLGAAGTRVEYLLLLLVAYAIPILLAFANRSPWLLAPLITIPRALQLVATIRRASDGPALNVALAGTAQLSLLFALCLAVGFLL